MPFVSVNHNPLKTKVAVCVGLITGGVERRKCGLCSGWLEGKGFSGIFSRGELSLLLFFVWQTKKVSDEMI